MSPIIEKVGESFYLGEGPHWDVQSQTLYLIDAFPKLIARYDPKTNTVVKAILEGESLVNFIIPVDGEQNKFIVGSGQDLLLVTWDSASDKVPKVEISATIGDPTAGSINDAKADAKGRLWFGTISAKFDMSDLYNTPKDSDFYSYDATTKTLKKHFKVALSNGLIWNDSYTKLYYIDSMERAVSQFDFDLNTATVSNQKTIFTLDKHDIPGVPDGQTIDTDGNLWVAIFDGSRVIKIDPRRPETLLQTVNLPVKQVTSVAFGGLNLDELYVTTGAASFNNDPAPPADEGNGYIYRVTGLGVKGLPACNARI